MVNLDTQGKFKLLLQISTIPIKYGEEKDFSKYKNIVTNKDILNLIIEIALNNKNLKEFQIAEIVKIAEAQDSKMCKECYMHVVMPHYHYDCHPPIYNALSYIYKLLRETDDFVSMDVFQLISLLRGKEITKENQVIRQGIIQELLKVFKDDNRRVRGEAAEALAALDAKETVPDIINLIKDELPNSFIEHHVIVALNMMRIKAEDIDRKIITELMELVKDKNHGIRRRSVSVLSQIEARESFPAVVELLKDENSLVRRGAMIALSKFNAQKAIPELIRKLIDEDKNVRVVCVNMLSRIGARESAPEMIKLLQDEDAWVRSCAAAALGIFGSKESILDLIKLLKEEDYRVRAHAAMSLVQLGAKDKVHATAIEDIKKALLNGCAVSDRAFMALKELGLSDQEIEKLKHN
jgi:HEAT repeat protein